MVPPENKDPNYYIGWFKQFLGTNDATLAREGWEHFKETGEMPHRGWKLMETEKVTVDVRLIVVEGGFAEAVERAGENVFTSEIVGVEASGRERWTVPAFRDWAFECRQMIRRGELHAAFAEVKPDVAKRLMPKAFEAAGRARGESCWFVVTLDGE